MSVRRRFAPTTTAAIGVISTLTLVFAVFAIREISALNSGRSLESDEVLLGLTGDTADNATWLSAGLILVVCLMATGMVLGLARRNTGARYAAITLFLFLGCLSIGASVAGMTSTPPARNFGFGLLCGVVDLVIVGLLLAKPTALDFDQAEVDRQRRMARG